MASKTNIKKKTIISLKIRKKILGKFETSFNGKDAKYSSYYRKFAAYS